MRKVLILTDLKGWHYNQLENSFSKLDISVESACLEELSIRIENDISKIYMNNNESIFNRLGITITITSFVSFVVFRLARS